MQTLNASSLLFPEIPAVPRLPELPQGFRYWRDFLSVEDEQEILAGIATLDLRPSQYHEYTALRRTATFSLSGRGVPVPRFTGTLADRWYGPTGSGVPERRRPVDREVRPLAPGWLRWVAGKVARHVGRDPADFQHALVTEYPPGAPIGWHRDAPPFAQIYGISLASDCKFCLRPYVPPREGEHNAAGPSTPAQRAATVKLTAERRSLYLMAGLARSSWQHSIPPVKEMRYSITLRTL